MTFDALRMLRRNKTRSFAGLVGLILLASVAIVGSTTQAEDEPARGASRDTTAAMRLPPRTSGSDNAPSSRKSTSTGGSLWTTVISLTAIVGSLGLVAYWLRPYLGVSRGLPIEALELLGRRVIEQKVTIHLVRCGGKVLIVGVSPDGARTLSEITDPVEVQRLIKTCHAPREARSIATQGQDARDMNGADPAAGMNQAVPSISGVRTAVPRTSSFQTEDTRRG